MNQNLVRHRAKLRLPFRRLAKWRPFLARRLRGGHVLRFSGLAGFAWAGLRKRGLVLPSFFQPICSHTPCCLPGGGGAFYEPGAICAQKSGNFGVCGKIGGHRTFWFPFWFSLKWPWGRTYGDPILGWMNIHLPPILMFSRGTGF